MIRLKLLIHTIRSMGYVWKTGGEVSNWSLTAQLGALFAFISVFVFAWHLPLSGAGKPTPGTGRYQPRGVHSIHQTRFRGNG
jgi:hypothetical protein